jgi:hypothetical protein
MKENEIQNLLDKWLKDKFFKGSNTLIQSEVKFKIADFHFSADLIAIQSKSNIIHGFEIKSRLNQDNILSAIWQTNSYYTNYKWLVIPENDKHFFDTSLFSEKLLGIGLITFNTDKEDFSVLRQAKYTDGNFLKFLPELEEQWLTINKSEKK